MAAQTKHADNQGETKLGRRVPAPTIERLALYLLCLKSFLQKGIETVSSEDIARVVGRNAPQVRKDLSYFGQFGIPGVGYNVAELRSGLARIMGLQDAKKVILVGAGSLGSALCRYQGFREEGFDICAIFDSDHAKVGQRLGKVQIQHISELTSTNRELKADMALIAVPAYASQAVANLLVEAGIDSIVTFAPTAIEVASNVLVRRVDLTKELAVLSCYTELRDEVPNVSTPD